MKIEVVISEGDVAKCPCKVFKINGETIRIFKFPESKNQLMVCNGHSAWSKGPEIPLSEMIDFYKSTFA